MHFITILKSNSEIVDYKIDASVPTHWNVDSVKNAVSKNLNIDIGSIETFALETEPNRDNNVSGNISAKIHKFYNGLVIKNQDYVEPVINYTWFIDSIRKCLTLRERVKWDNDFSETIKTAKIEIGPGIKREQLLELLGLLVEVGDMSQATADKIIALETIEV